VFGKSYCNIIVFNVAAVKVNSCQERFSVLESGNDKIVVVRILVVSSFVTDSSQIIGIIFNSEVNIVIVRF